MKLLRRRRLRRDLEAELAFHRDMAGAHGNPIPLGNAALIKEQAFDLWRFNAVENLWRDLLYATRTLGRSPGFVLSALLSLGLGIGVNTTIFSIAVELLLSRPSVSSAKSLVYIRIGGNSHAKPAVIEFLRRSGAFEDVAGENEETYINWNDGHDTRRLFAVQATKNYFTALGIPVDHGRGWNTNDPDTVAVLRHQFWQTHLNSDPSVVGRSILLDGRAYTVVGILPESHRTLIGYGFSPDVYVPRYIDHTLLAIYARLKPGMTAGQCLAAVQTIAERLDRELPETWKYNSSVSMVAIGGFARLKQDNEAMSIALFFMALLILVGLVLLIACVNVAGLLLARPAARRQEIAIRLSLGASSWRLLQQLLAESLLLSFAGAALGFLFALAAARLLAAVHLPIPIPIQLHIEPDWRVMAYAAALAIAATIASGLLPAWQSLNDSLTFGLRRERRLRARRVMVVAQVAVCFIVLAAGALFVHNLFRSTAISPGFDVHHTLRAEALLPPSTYRDSRRIVPYVEQGLRELRAIPGIQAAAAARIVPFTDSTRFSSTLTFTATGNKPHASFHWNAVTPDFFRVLDIAVLFGHTFSAEDRSNIKPVIVNTAFVKRYLEHSDPIGATFLWGEGKDLHRIVGVVSGTKNLTIGEADYPQLYESLSLIENDRPRIQFIVRSATPPAAQLAAVRQALRRVEPAAGLEVATLFSSIGLAFLPSQVGAALAGAVGLLGLLLAAIGIYGVFSYSISRRTREIGIRLAIGATRREIAGMILLESARLLAAGIIAGLAIALFVTRPLSMFLVPGLSPSDPVSFGLVTLAVSAAGLIATLGPVRRAYAVDPMTSLRYE